MTFDHVRATFLLTLRIPKLFNCRFLRFPKGSKYMHKSRSFFMVSNYFSRLIWIYFLTFVTHINMKFFFLEINCSVVAKAHFCLPEKHNFWRPTAFGQTVKRDYLPRVLTTLKRNFNHKKFYQIQERQ